MSSLHEECGVFGIYSPESADLASSVYYGLYALQHRGQESCGIVVNDDGVFYSHKDLGLVSEIFTKEVIAHYPLGRIAVGHVRYGTTGGNSRSNCQPIEVNHSKGKMALAHNGNLVNAAELRSALAEGGYPAPADVGDLTACVCHSLADCYRAAVDELEALTGRRIACLRVVGGGCRNDYLNRLTARALARPLTAGPAEATAIGNLLSQLLHAGEIHTLAEGRALVRASFTLKAYA